MLSCGEVRHGRRRTSGWPLSCAASSMASIRPRNSRDSTLTGMRKSGRRRSIAGFEREPTARHDHVHVRMMGHRRAPGVEHRGDADPAPRRLGSAAIVRVVSADALNRDCRPRPCSGRRCRALGSAACRRRESKVRATVRLRARRATACAAALALRAMPIRQLL